MADIRAGSCRTDWARVDPQPSPHQAASPSNIIDLNRPHAFTPFRQYVARFQFDLRPQMMQSAIPTAKVALAAAAQGGKQASAGQEDFEGVPVAPMASSDAIVTSKTAKTEDVDAAGELSHQRRWSISKLTVVSH